LQLFCIGDIAVSKDLSSQQEWVYPGGLRMSSDVQVLFNMELPLGGQINIKPRSRGPRLLSDPELVRRIKEWSPGFAALATNHILDAGEDGLANTITSLQREGFITVGAGMTPQEIIKPLFWDTAEGKLAILNWVFPETNPDWMRTPGPNCWPGINEATSVIRELKQEVDWVLVFAHWSDELFAYPSSVDREIARGLIEAGAAMIIGHHPHVVRGMELIAEKPVFYSLGNFFFSEFRDQKGDLNFRPVSRNREVLVVKITFLQGQEPKIETLSFWQYHNLTKPDPLDRAVRRMKNSSRPLKKYLRVEYLNWYERRRTFFNSWEYRINFSLKQKGWIGAIGYLFTLLNRFRKFNKNHSKSNDA
jgi:hypothetical protein